MKYQIAPNWALPGLWEKYIDQDFFMKYVSFPLQYS